MDISNLDVARFGHLLGVVLLAAASGIEWTSLRLIRRATTVEDLRRSAAVGAGLQFVFPFVTILILLSGSYIVDRFDAWSRAWVLTALGTFIAMSVLGALIASRRLKGIEAAAESAAPGPLPPDLAHRAADPVLWATEFLLAAWLVGIILLKVIKPEIAGALGIVGGATLVGLAGAFLSSRGSVPVAYEPPAIEVTGTT